jgi:GntR family transcriptional regulator / MocR family aminotransferase
MVPMTASTPPRRSPAGLPILIPLDAGAPEPLFRQLYRAVRDAIASGRLARGMRLPSTRALADDLGLSRNTVVGAFEQLAAEGYITSRVGRGTRVANVVPDALARAAGGRRLSESKAPGTARVARRMATLARLATPKSMIADAAPPFRPGVPALEEFPLSTWTRLLSARARGLRGESLNYTSPAGAPALRRAIARYVAAARGVRCDDEQVLIVGGTQQALRLAAEVLLEDGDQAWVEDPGYQGALGALAAVGAQVVGVPVDDEGIDVEAGRARAPSARLAYVSPSHQFPLGVTMTLARRTRLLDWASSAGAWILEDDYDSEFRYASRPLTALQGLDGAGRVIYCGTMSKVLFPALRIGYLIVPPSLVDAFRTARGFADVQQPVLEQLALADFIDEGHFERHVRRMRVLYRERRDALIHAVAAELGDTVALGPSEGGMHAVLWLPEHVNAREVQARAAARGIDAIPVSAFAIDRACASGLLLGYAHMLPVAIRDSLRVLAGVLAGMAPRGAAVAGKVGFGG